MPRSSDVDFGINDLITLNLDIRQFAQDVIDGCEGPDLLRALWHAIEKVTILDPTCGSGAFLFAALNILEPLYEACLDRMEAMLSDEAAKLDPDKRKTAPNGVPLLPHGKYEDFSKVLEQVAAHPNRRYFIFKSIILNNLYGVDLMEEAVEICKLRLFLKLAAQVEPDAARPNSGIEPLPDVDFNIRAGNTLVGFASMEEIRRVLGSDLEKQFELPAIEEKAALADKQFQLFRKMQTEQGMDAKDYTGAKQKLRERLKALEDELNRLLAVDYGVKTGKKGEYEKWIKSHQPFHWLVDFYGIVQGRGGFDVIIGNPPYVEYKEVKSEYQLRGFKTESCGNLYAFASERCIVVARESSRIGLIIPVASVCTEGYSSLREIWLAEGQLIVSSFNDRPGRLFDGLEHIRLAIVLLYRNRDHANEVHVSSYNKWLTEARNPLFERLFFQDASKNLRNDCIAKISSDIETKILEKLLARKKSLFYHALDTSKYIIYYTRKLSWFVQVLGFVPRITDGSGKERRPSELKEIPVSSKDERDAFLCLLNSSLFYWYLTVWSDCRNLNKREVLGIPFELDKINTLSVARMADLANELMKDFRKNSRVVQMNYSKWGTKH